ncbi:hypothetical protein [Marinagarivorans algicola]|uniref:hypothetical protein n=1 Tax=Marinagarivorans algicola TaxID=1513270 RepID=UPI0006B9389C|nr:hypothetical protein [Marinagarivorans algicola]
MTAVILSNYRFSDSGEIARIITVIGEQKFFVEPSFSFGGVTCVDEKMLFKNFSRFNLFSLLPYVSSRFRVSFDGLTTYRRFLKKHLEPFLFEGDNVSVFHDQCRFSRAFMRGQVELIEDGLVNYVHKPVGSYLKRCFRLLFLHSLSSQTYVMGESKSISSILLFSTPLAHPLIHKVTVFDLPKPDAFQAEDRRLLLSCYEMEGVVRRLSSRSTQNIVMLTQALDVAGLTNTRLKSEIYEGLFTYLESKGFNVFVKLHPADTCLHYNERMRQSVLPNFPVELLNFTDLSNISMVALCTSASLQLDNSRFSVVNCFDDLTILSRVSTANEVVALCLEVVSSFLWNSDE